MIKWIVYSNEMCYSAGSSVREWSEDSSTIEEEYSTTTVTDIESSSMRGRFEDLNSMCQTRDTEIERLNSEIEKLRKDSNRNAEALFQAEDQNVELINKLKSTNEQLKKIRHMEETISSLESSVDLLQRRNDLLQEQLEQKTADVANLKRTSSEKIEKLLMRSEVDTKNHTELTLQNIALSKVVEEQKEEIDRLQANLEDLKETSKKTEEEHMSIMDEILATDLSDQSMRNFGCSSCFRRGTNVETEDKWTDTDGLGDLENSAIPEVEPMVSREVQTEDDSSFNLSGESFSDIGIPVDKECQTNLVVDPFKMETSQSFLNCRNIAVFVLFSIALGVYVLVDDLCHKGLCHIRIHYRSPPPI